MYRDSEMVIWFGAGRGLAFLLTPLFRFAWPVLLLVAALALFAWPWANQQIQDMKDRYEQRGDLDRITPGQFQESANGTRVFFIDKDSPDNRTGNNVFISAVDHGKEAVTSARSARIDTIDAMGEGRFLMLSNGQRLESTIGKPELKISEFKEYGTRIGSKALSTSDTVAPRARSTMDLLREPTPLNRGELGWRIGLALASMNFVVLALALSSREPALHRGGGLMFALFAFVVYFNLLNLGQSWVGSGRLSLGLFMLALHGGIFGLSLSWLLARHHHWSWRSLLPAGQRRLEGSSRMRTIRRLIYKEVVASVTFVTLGFLALFFFFDFVDELRWIGRNAAGPKVATSSPRHWPWWRCRFPAICTSCCRSRC
jgi:lipopolysaccharide export system permease protein